MVYRHIEPYLNSYYVSVSMKHSGVLLFLIHKLCWMYVLCLLIGWYQILAARIQTRIASELDLCLGCWSLHTHASLYGDRGANLVLKQTLIVWSTTWGNTLQSLQLMESKYIGFYKPTIEVARTLARKFPSIRSFKLSSNGIMVVALMENCLWRPYKRWP